MRGIRGGGVPGVDWGRGSVGRAGSGTRGAGAGSQRERGAAPCPPHGPDAGPSPGPALRSPRPGPASRPSVPLRAGQALAAAGAPAAPQRWPGCLQEETQLLLLSQKPKKGEPKGWGWPAPSFRASLPPRHHSHPDLPARAAQAGTAGPRLYGAAAGGLGECAGPQRAHGSPVPALRGVGRGTAGSTRVAVPWAPAWPINVARLGAWQREAGASMRCLPVASRLWSPLQQCRGPWCLTGAGDPSLVQAARCQAAGEPSWEASALSCSLASSEQVASDWGWDSCHGATVLGAMGCSRAGRWGGAWVPGAAGVHWGRGAGCCMGTRDARAAAEHRNRVVCGCWGPQGCSSAGGWGADSALDHSLLVLFAVGAAGVQLWVCSQVSPMQQIPFSVLLGLHFCHPPGCT